MQQPENGRWADAQVAEIVEEPYYLPVGDEVTIFEAAYAQKLPVMLKGRLESARHAFSAIWLTG